MRKIRPHGRLSLLVVLALIAGVLALAAPAVAAPMTIDLIAGQDTDVGDLTVSNDGINLYVTFTLTGNWCMTESHLAVATSLAGIPENKSGNPQPGQFSYGDVYDPCATGDSFTVPLAGIPADPGDALVIAAHAKVRLTTVVVPGPSWATSVEGYSQGLRKDLTPVLPERSVATNALVSDYTGGAVTFFSLGFGGWLTAGFECKVINGPGADIRIYEVTNGTYPLEQAVVASQDGVTWTTLGTASNTGGGPVTTSSFDLGSLAYANYVRVTDTSNPAIFEPAADGFDLDGIRALQDCVEYTYESAWGDGTGFLGSNWAMYFGYTVQGVATDLQQRLSTTDLYGSGAVFGSATFVVNGTALTVDAVLDGAAASQTFTVWVVINGAWHQVDLGSLTTDANGDGAAHLLLNTALYPAATPLAVRVVVDNWYPGSWPLPYIGYASDLVNP